MVKNSYKILQIWYESRACFPFVFLSVIRSCCTQINFFFLLNSEEPHWSTQKYVTKKRYGHVDHDFDSLAQFRSTYCMEKRMEVFHVYAMVSWSMLWTVSFWLINLSDRLILLIFVLDLRLDNMLLKIDIHFLIVCSL